jgi:plastocyanin
MVRGRGRRIVSAAIAATVAAGASMVGPPASAAPVGAVSDLLVVDRDLSGGGKVIRVDPATGDQTLVTADGNLKDPFGAAMDANGDLIVADQDAGPGALGEVIRVDPSTGFQTVISAGGMFKAPSDVAVERNGDLIVVDPAALDTNGAVFRVDPVTGAQSIVTQDGYLRNPRGVTLEATGYILVADEHTAGGGGGRVIGVDPVTGTQAIVSPQGQFFTPLGIAVEADGSVVVGDENAYTYASGGVVRVTRPSGAQAEVTSDGYLHATSGIAVDPSGQLIVASQDGFAGDGSYGDVGGGIVRVDPVTGAQTPVSPVAGTTDLFHDPIEVVISARQHVAALDDYFLPSAVQIRPGGSVVWDFTGTRTHTATDATGMSLYDSGLVAPGGPSFEYGFDASGTYRFVCTLHEGMRGRVWVLVRVSKATRHRGLPVRFTWATGPAPADSVYDVQLKRPRKPWRAWHMGETAASARFVAKHAGTFKVRARLRSLITGRAEWSPATRFIAT